MSHQKTLETDFFYKFYVDARQSDQLYAAVDANTNGMIAGYVAGVNRYYRETAPDRIDESCRGKPWLREVTPTDVHKILVDKAILAIGGNFIEPIAGARPPQSVSAAAPATVSKAAAAALSNLGVPALPLAGNAWAFGRDKVEGGGSVLMGNPHFPWVTSNRFYQARISVPGIYEVAGGVLGGLPLIQIGYNKDFAWSHTVSTGKRFTIYELNLKPGDPLTYIVDGVERPMAPTDVSVEVRAGAAVSTTTRRMYKTEFGAMLAIPAAGLAWSTERAYALADVNLTNNRLLSGWYDLGRARSVREAQQALSRNLGNPWVNTVGADAAGEVIYADITTVPNVEAADIARCAPTPRAAALLNVAGRLVLNGSTASCKWTADASTPVPGLMPAAKLPSLIRTDFVFNGNDSFCLTNPAHTWPAFSPMLGPVAIEQRPRTRAALATFDRRFAGKDGLPGTMVSAEKLEALWYRNENFMAGVVLDDLLSTCAANPAITLANGATVQTAAACAALASWDRRSDRASRGTHVFREFWRPASLIRGVYAVPFNAAIRSTRREA
ncbi:MAG: penicillin acylase family protein [Noviherbaspirillum sp.]